MNFEIYFDEIFASVTGQAYINRGYESFVCINKFLILWLKLFAMMNIHTQKRNVFFLNAYTIFSKKKN